MRHLACSNRSGLVNVNWVIRSRFIVTSFHACRQQRRFMRVLGAVPQTRVFSVRKHMTCKSVYNVIRVAIELNLIASRIHSLATHAVPILTFCCARPVVRVVQVLLPRISHNDLAPSSVPRNFLLSTKKTMRSRKIDGEDASSVRLKQSSSTNVTEAFTRNRPLMKFDKTVQLLYQRVERSH